MSLSSHKRGRKICDFFTFASRLICHSLWVQEQERNSMARSAFSTQAKSWFGSANIISTPPYSTEPRILYFLPFRVLLSGSPFGFSLRVLLIKAKKKRKEKSTVVSPNNCYPQHNGRAYPLFPLIKEVKKFAKSWLNIRSNQFISRGGQVLR